MSQKFVACMVAAVQQQNNAQDSTTKFGAGSTLHVLRTSQKNPKCVYSMPHGPTNCVVKTR